jgi:hypothetical protein
MKETQNDYCRIDCTGDSTCGRVDDHFDRQTGSVKAGVGP